MKTNTIKILTIIAAALCVISVSTMIYFLIKLQPFAKPKFTPPPFESSAVAVEDELKETVDMNALGWTVVEREGMNYRAYICGRVVLNRQNEADLWFYSPADNNALLKLRIYDSQEKVIAETGLIKPGEYLQTVEFNRALADDEAISMKIMAYVPETYASAGAVSLNTVVMNNE